MTIYTITVKTEDGEAWSNLRKLITESLDGGNPYYFDIKMRNSWRLLAETKTPPNRNIKEDD